MNGNAYTSYSTQTLNHYKEQEILMSSPEQCVLHVYDIAIKGCVKQEPQKAGKALAALIDSLDFEADGDMSMRLFRLYEYCMTLIYKKEYDNPLKILKDLRETWQIAISQQVAA